MRILVCFKIVRDLDTVIDTDWETANDAAFRIDYTKKQINEADQGALEAALRIKDGMPGTQVHAVTVSDDAPDSFFTGLFAVGFDACYRIAPQQDLTYRPLDTAGQLAGFVRQSGPYDVILTGAQAPPGDSRQVPYALAEMLGVPCIDHVRLIEAEGEALKIRRQILPLDEVYEIRTPAVFAMENPRFSYLRIPTLRERMKASGRKAEVICAAIEEAEGIRPVKLEPARTKRSCRFIEPGDTGEILSILQGAGHHPEGPEVSE